MGARANSIGYLILNILLAVFFLLAAGTKFVGIRPIVQEFNEVGFGQWFRIFTAVLELSGAILLLLPGKTVFGAMLLAIVCVGAFFAQLLAIHHDVIHTIVLSGILGAIAWKHRSQLPVNWLRAVPVK